MPQWKPPPQVKSWRDKIKGFAPNWLTDIVAPDEPDPSSFVNPMSVGLAGPLISIYKDAQGIPSAAARIKGTQKFLDSARGLVGDVSNPIYSAAMELTKKYPRVAAHMRVLPHAPVDMQADASVTPAFGKVISPMSLKFSQYGKAKMERLPEQAMDTMFHEATHVGQALMNKDMTQLYRLFNDFVGYPNNPFERSAVWAGTKAKYGINKAAKFAKGKINRSTTILQDMKKAVQPSSRVLNDEELFAREKIKLILKRRGILPEDTPIKMDITHPNTRRP